MLLVLFNEVVCLFVTYRVMLCVLCVAACFCCLIVLLCLVVSYKLMLYNCMCLCVCLLWLVCCVNVFVCFVCDLMRDDLWFHVCGAVASCTCYC